MNIHKPTIYCSIRPIIAAALAVSVPVAMVFPAAPASAAVGDLDKAVAALRAVSTLKADFVQTDRAGQRISGQMTLKRPGKIRFQYEKGVPLLIVSDGKALTLVDYEVNQVQRWPIGKSPLGALLDPKRDMARYGVLKPTGNPNVISIEVRDPGKPEYGTINLIFTRDASAPGGMELVSWVALDSQNNRYGIDVSDSTFRFKDPRRTGRR
jgi:outer membrane lipoprotein-sorting protein